MGARTIEDVVIDAVIEEISKMRLCDLGDEAAHDAMVQRAKARVAGLLDEHISRAIGEL